MSTSISTAEAPDALALDLARDAEAREELLRLAHRKCTPLTDEQVVDHVLRVVPSTDFAIRRDALAALLRRIASANAQRWEVSPRSPRGTFHIRARSSGSAVYRVWLRSRSPLEGSCSCADFARSAIALCKHLIAVWPRAGRRSKTVALSLAAARLEWNPVRPLEGPGDWLERLRWSDGSSSRTAPLALAAARRHFAVADGRAHGTLMRAHADAAGARRGLIADLIRACSTVGAGRLLCDPAIPPLLDREWKSIERVGAGEPVQAELSRHLKDFRLKLFPYQLEGVNRFLSRGRLLLGDDMGLGKTAQAIACCHALFSSGVIRRGLLIVPAALKPQWQREWQRVTDVPLAMVEGTAEARASMYRKWREGFLVTNYEQVLRDLPHVQKLGPELVVLDEAQRIKNWAAKTSATVKQLDPRWRLVLTGTPMENRLEELASLMDWVDDLALEPKWRLPSVHAIRTDGAREVIGARNLSTLRARIEPSFLRRTRAEVLDQLPPRRDNRVPVELCPEQLEEHAELDVPIARLVASGRRRPLTQEEFLKLMTLLTQQRIICNGLAQHRFAEIWPAVRSASKPSEALLRSLFSPKLLELRELVQQLVGTQQRKVVVFSQWRRMLQLASWAIGDILDGCGARAAFFTGEEGQRRRSQNVVDFHDDPSVRVLFCTDAGGVGLNLQRAASCCINLELPWNPAVLEQRIGRIYRLGQTQPVDVYHLVSTSGLESRIATLVESKRELFRGLFDGQSDEVTFEQSGSFLSRVERLITPAAVPASTSAESDDGLAELGEEALDGSDSIEATTSPSAPLPSAAGGSAIPLQPVSSTPGEDLAGQVRSWIGALRIHSGDDGGLTIQAPPEAARVLAAMFSGLAQLLSSAAQR